MHISLPVLRFQKLYLRLSLWTHCTTILLIGPNISWLTSIKILTDKEIIEYQRLSAVYCEQKVCYQQYVPLYV